VPAQSAPSKASPEELDAWGLCARRITSGTMAFRPRGISDSLNLLRRAVELDPHYANAHAFLGLYLIEKVALHALRASRARSGGGPGGGRSCL